MSKYRKPGPAEINLGRVIRSPRARLYLYGIAGAVVPLLVAYGIISEAHSALWIALAAAIFGTGTQALAAANVPTEDPDD